MEKFVLGLNHETTGTYSNDDAAYVSQFEIGEERNQVELALMKERISDSDILNLFVKKFYFMWGSDDDLIMWSTAHFTTLEYSSTLQFLERVIYILMMFFGALSGGKLIRDYTNNRMNPAVLLFVLLILGYVAIHLLIEIQTRYRYFIMPSFIILQSYGIYFILDFLFRLKIINRLLFKY